MCKKTRHFSCLGHLVKYCTQKVREIIPSLLLIKCASDNKIPFLILGNMAASVEVKANPVPRDSRKYLRNNPLEEDVEHMVDKIEVAADTFLNFLQQNYLPFFGSMKDIVLASAHLADSEFLLSSWPFDDSGTTSRALKVHIYLGIKIF
jgi:hypothetical protein